MAQAGKHCFVEKPLATTAADAERAVAGRGRSAGQDPDGRPSARVPPRGRPAEGADRRAASSGALYYLYGNRLNLGVLRDDENALWSLGAHDVSVVLRLIGEEPEECLAHGASYVREGVQDVVFCFLRFPSGIVAHLHLSAGSTRTRSAV